jgi:hypothetical protein
MIAFHEKTTKELIELLIKEENRVTLEHIRELVARPDAIEPLRQILRDKRYWEETETHEWWSSITHSRFSAPLAERN